MKRSASIPKESKEPINAMDPVAKPLDKESVQKLLIKKVDASVSDKLRSIIFDSKFAVPFTYTMDGPIVMVRGLVMVNS